jgi:hypothetical protein
MVPTFGFTSSVDVRMVFASVALLSVSAGAFIAALSEPEEQLAAQAAQDDATRSHDPLDRAA